MINNNDSVNSFYNNNVKKDLVPNVRDIKDSIIIMTYNVHCWRNLNNKISDADNYKSIYKMIKKMVIDVIVFQEVAEFGKNDLNFIIKDYETLGFNQYAYCINGKSITDSTKNSYILVLSRLDIDVAKNINITVHKSPRNCLYMGIKNGLNKFYFAAVHLEIGERFNELSLYDKKRNEIIFNNVLMRKWQVERIISAFTIYDNEFGIDALIGDFNFDIKDQEFDWIINEKKYLWDGVKVNTTPYNRVDYVLSNSKSKYIINNSKIVKCNFSDHLPVITELYKYT